MRYYTEYVEELQRIWGDKPCNHDKGYGHEIDSETGSDSDCFCLQCGRRHLQPDFFKNKLNIKKEEDK